MGHIRLSIGRHLYRIFHRFLTIRSAREACWYSKNIAFECLESFNIEGMTPCIRLNEDLVSWDSGIPSLCHVRHEFAQTLGMVCNADCTFSMRPTILLSCGVWSQWTSWD